MNTMLSAAILLLIVVTSMAFIVSIGGPIIDAAVKTSDIKSAEDDLHFIDNYIRTVSREGKDAVRIYKFTTPKSFESIPGEDAIQFSTDSPSQLLEHLTRSFSGSFAYVSGADVSCQEKDGDGDGITDLVAENNRLKAVFRKTSPDSAILTDRILLRLTDKTNSVNISVSNSSITINEDPATASGVGYTEIGKSGTNLPVCYVHAYINSTIDYDIYYKLYAGADFLVIEVRNVK